VADKPVFCDVLKFRRCLVLTDGFYEWQKTGKAKQPYCFEVNDGQLLAFAGLWEMWKDPARKILETCTILTTTPNAVISAVHDRMPVSTVITTTSSLIQERTMLVLRPRC